MPFGVFLFFTGVAPNLLVRLFWRVNPPTYSCPAMTLKYVFYWQTIDFLRFSFVPCSYHVITTFAAEARKCALIAHMAITKGEQVPIQVRQTIAKSRLA